MCIMIWETLENIILNERSQISPQKGQIFNTTYVKYLKQARL